MRSPPRRSCFCSRSRRQSPSRSATRRRRSTRPGHGRSPPTSSRRPSRICSRSPRPRPSSTSRSSPRSSRSRRSTRDGKEDSTGLGAGVIVNARGSILTALHVVEGAAQHPGLLRRRHRGRRPRSISTDPEHDIAVLAPQRAARGDRAGRARRAAAQVGDEAYAVGHPLGYVGSLTAGVISGLDRSVNVHERQDAEGTDPVRRGRQPRQLRRAAAQPRRRR